MPDLKAVVTLFDANNEPVAHLGDGQQSDGKTYKSIRNDDAFTAGELVAAHDECFDRDENIFAAE